MRNKNLFLLLLFISIVLSSFICKAQDNNDGKALLPQMLAISNELTEYYFSIPPCFEDESAGYQNSIKIFVTSPVKTVVTVEIEGSGYLSTKQTIPNDVIEFNITPVQAQPYTKMGKDPNVPERVFPGRGIHVKADQPTDNRVCND